MAWLSKFVRKSARRASSAAGRVAKRQVRRAAPSFLTPQSWDKPRKKTQKTASKAKQKPSAKPPEERSSAAFWGRALGLAYSRFKRRSKTAGPVLLLVEPPKSFGPATKPTHRSQKPSSSSNAPTRRRKKGERVLTDPRFERTQAKYEARKVDHLFEVRLPTKSLLLQPGEIAKRMPGFRKLPGPSSILKRKK